MGCALPFLIIIAALASAILPFLAAAQTASAGIPQVDIKGACTSYFLNKNLSPQAIVFCIEKEENAKYNLPILWASVTSSVKKNCIAIDYYTQKHANPYRYSSLTDCIIMFSNQDRVRAMNDMPPLPDDYAETLVRSRAR